MGERSSTGKLLALGAQGSNPLGRVDALSIRVVANRDIMVWIVMPSYTRLDHDEAVRRYALSLVATGYDVRARVEGWFDPPEYIDGYRPDIVARIGDHFIIVEIKKGDTDWPKISALERFVLEHQGFEIKIVTPEDVLRPAVTHSHGA